MLDVRCWNDKVRKDSKVSKDFRDGVGCKEDKSGARVATGVKGVFDVAIVPYVSRKRLVNLRSRKSRAWESTSNGRKRKNIPHFFAKNLAYVHFL